MIARFFSKRPTWALTALALSLVVLSTAGCKKRVESRFSSQSGDAGAASNAAAMVEADFAKLDALATNIPLQLSPPSVLLDARSSSDGKDVLVTITQPEGVANAPWNRLEVASNNANFRDIGVRPGDSIKLYLFPDSETRERQNATGEVDAQMVTHEATDLLVAQVLGDRALQVVEGVTPPRDLEVRIPEQTYLETFGLAARDLDVLRERGQVDAFGVKLPAQRVPLDQLPGLVPTIAWPPRIEVWRVKDERMKAINRALGGYTRDGEPPLGWEPTPDSQELSRLVESFNRWLRSRKSTEDVAPPKLLDTLPETLRADARLAKHLSAEAINSSSFQDYEGRLIQQASWCRDIGSWSAGDDFDPAPRAARLFDWVARNVTLSDSPRLVNHHPWQTLVYGRGNALKRVWLFAQLCRQQRISCCVVELPPAEGQDVPWLWCGVLDHGKLHLIDPQLGLRLVSSTEEPLTLDAVLADPSWVRAFDLPDAAYPVTAEQLERASVAAIAEPMTLSSRALQLQGQQSGSSALVLHVDVDAAAAELAEAAGVEAVKLWDHPFSNLVRELRLGDSGSVAAERTRNAAAIDIRPFCWTPHLWKARLLYFRGVLETEREAKKKGVLHDPVNDHRAAAQLYLHRRVRPSEKKLAELVANQDRLRIYHETKAAATLWLAVLMNEEGRHEQALQWFERVDLSQGENARHADAVLYGKARALEGLGRLEEAAALYQQDNSAQRLGNLMRAARLAADAADAADVQP